MGSLLIEKGLKSGESPEEWNLKRPEVIQCIHRDYFEAGANIVLTNTFGANPIKLGAYSLTEKVEEINRGGVERALSVRPAQPEGPRFVAGDIGPTGKFLQPLDNYTYSEFRDAFARQAAALAAAGADLICIETMYDKEEVRAALEGALEATGLPVFATMTFQRSRTGFATMMGVEAVEAMRLLETTGASAVGANCSTGAQDMLELVQVLRGATGLPLIAQPNAGNPVIEEGTARYLQSPEEFSQEAFLLVESGVSFVGGCCGTNPDFIRALANRINQGFSK